MKKQILVTLFVAITTLSYGQLHFVIDNTSPCPGQSVTFSLPSISGCSNPRVPSEADWNIYPVPARSEVNYNFSAQNGVVGYVSVTLTYVSFYPTISVHARYACNGTPGGTVSDLILMVPPPGNPTMSGLNDNIYSGDETMASISAANAAGYSWDLSVVQIVSGNISRDAIANPLSQQTVITWPADFVGIVDVVATVNGCSESKQLTRRVSVLTPPSALLYESSVAPPAHCAGTSMRYRLEVFGGFTITQAQLIASEGATDITIFNSNNGVPVEWSVRWMRSGGLRIRYSVSSGTRMWTDLMTPIVPFDVIESDAGEIQPIPIANYCAPINVVLSLNRQPSRPYVFQSCSTGDCSVGSSWNDNDPPASSTFSNISTNTRFRIKLTETLCGSFQSAPGNISVKQTPSIEVSDKTMFSGGAFDIPSSNLPFSIVTVRTISNGLTGASDVSLLQGSNTGTLATQTLVTNGQADGSAVYEITPSKNGCTGQTQRVTVTVYQLPVIYADRTYVYKGLTATLTTGNYDSYQWQTVSGEVLGIDTKYLVSVPGTYVVTVSKNGLRATSGPITIGGQFFNLNENYIHTRSPLREFTSPVGLDLLTEQDVSENIHYMDGLGRPRQNIDIRMSPSSHDIVRPIIYDRYGREARRFLPYVSSEDNGRIRYNAIASEQREFYQQPNSRIPSDEHPYADAVFEGSPLNRVIKQGAPGTAWQPNPDHPNAEHVIRYEYALNIVADSVMRFDSGATAFYSPGTLFKTKTTDEDGNDVIEFVDKLNRTVCRKVYAGEHIYAYTFYVFDEIGNLVTVIPPEGSKSIMTSLKR